MHHPYDMQIVRRDSVTNRLFESTSYYTQIQTAIKAAIEQTRGLNDVVEVTIWMDCGNEGRSYYAYIGDAFGPELDPTAVEYELSLAWHEHVTRRSNDWHECDA